MMAARRLIGIWVVALVAVAFLPLSTQLPTDAIDNGSPSASQGDILTAGAPVTVATAQHPPGFTFACGTDEPPSGDYLDVGLMQLFAYDCTTGVLTPKGTAASLCIRTGTPGNYHAVAGVCAIARAGTWNRHTGQGFAAVTGDYSQASWYTHQGCASLPDGKCIDRPNQGMSYTPVVSYSNQNVGFSYTGCTEADANGHITITGAPGTITAGHDGSPH